MGKLIDEKVDVKFDDVHMDVHMLVVKSLSRLKTCLRDTWQNLDIHSY